MGVVCAVANGRGRGVCRWPYTIAERWPRAFSNPRHGPLAAAWRKRGYRPTDRATSRQQIHPCPSSPSHLRRRSNGSRPGSWPRHLSFSDPLTARLRIRRLAGWRRPMPLSMRARTREAPLDDTVRAGVRVGVGTVSWRVWAPRLLARPGRPLLGGSARSSSWHGHFGRAGPRTRGRDRKPYPANGEMLRLGTPGAAAVRIRTAEIVLDRGRRIPCSRFGWTGGTPRDGAA